MKDLKALLFDFDGTLVNSIPKLFEVYLRFLSECGCEGSWDEFASMNGYSAHEICERLKLAHGLDLSEELIAERRYQACVEAYASEIDFFPDTLDFLLECKDNGYSLSIVTSAFRPIIDAFLQSHDVRDLFDHITTPEGLKASKPDPAIYELAQHQTGLGKHEVVAIEDAPLGMESALKAGLPTIAIDHYGKLASHKHQEAVVATVTSWGELRSILFESLYNVAG